MAKNNLNINDLSSWPILFRWLVAFVIVIIIGFTAYKLFIEPKENSILSSNKSIIKQKQILSSDLYYTANIKQYELEVEETKNALEQYKKHLTKEINMESLIINVHKAARDSGIIFQSFSPEKKDEDSDFYTIKSVFIETQTSFLNVTSFISQLTTLDRIIDIKKISFKTPKNTLRDRDNKIESNLDSLDVRAELNTFIFKEN